MTIVYVCLLTSPTAATMSPITAEEQLSKNNKLKKENIEYLRDWMSKQPHLPSGVTGKTIGRME